MCDENQIKKLFQVNDIMIWNDLKNFALRLFFLSDAQARPELKFRKLYALRWNDRNTQLNASEVEFTIFLN